MSEPFLSEIRAVSFNFPRKGWAACRAQLLPINQNQGLFALVWTTHGGGDAPVASNTLLAGTPAVVYGPPTSLTTLYPARVSSVGGSQPHTNMTPYLKLNFVIALQGILPSRN